MVALRVRWPLDLPVEEISELQIGVDPRAISPGVCGAQLERVLAVIQIAKLHIPVD